LIVLGPARLPDAARSIGKAVAEVRRFTAGFEAEVRSAFDPDRPPASSGDPFTAHDSGIDPGALAPGMSYGRSLQPEPTPESQTDAPAPADAPASADDADPGDDR
ncbi:MAG: Sec-independent protein translocase subunit TatA/TatB, partial [Acidimicrobiales bacterium]